MFASKNSRHVAKEKGPKLHPIPVHLRQPHRAPVAQLVERRAVTREVVSSTLAGPSLRVLK